MSVASSSSGASSCSRGPEDDLLLRQVRLGQLHLRQNRRALLSAVASSPPVPTSCEARTEDIHALVEGQQVQIWSKSQQRWLKGEVVQKADRDPGEILVLVRYGDPAREKWLDAALVAKFVRLAPLKLDKAAAGKSLLAQAMGLGANPTNFELPPGAAEVQLNF